MLRGGGGCKGQSLRDVREVGKDKPGKWMDRGKG